MGLLSVKRSVYACCPKPLRPYWDRVESSDLGYRLARGAFWSFAGAAISRGMMLAASILVARMLGKEAFGELGIVRSTVGMFGIFAGFGLGLTATKHVAEFRRSDPARTGRIIAMSQLAALLSGGLVVVAMFVAAPWLAANTLAAPQLSGLLRVGCVLLLLNTLNGVQTGALAGFEAFRTIARVNLVAGLASFVPLVAGAWLGGVEGAVWGLICNLAICWLLGHLALRSESIRAGVSIRFRGCMGERSTLWHFSLPAAASSLLVVPVEWGCAAMLVNRPDGYAEMGLFAAANHWRIAVLFIPASVCSIVLPMLSTLRIEEEPLRYRKLLLAGILLNGVIALAMALPIAVLSPLIMAGYGDGFRSGAIVLVLLVLGAVVPSVTSVVGRAIASQGKMWASLALNLAWASCAMAFTYLLLDHGAAGLAMAMLLAQVVNLFNVGIYARTVCLQPITRPLAGERCHELAS